jgi:hypothetical protein
MCWSHAALRVGAPAVFGDGPVIERVVVMRPVADDALAVAAGEYPGGVWLVAGSAGRRLVLDGLSAEHVGQEVNGDIELGVRRCSQLEQRLWGLLQLHRLHRLDPPYFHSWRS